MTGELRIASTVCLLRDGLGGFEVLMVRRTPSARFMAGAWVFPGGAVDESDGSPLATSAVSSDSEDLLRWRAAALRELVEETGIWLYERGATSERDRSIGEEVFRIASGAGSRLDGNALRYFANWITPTPLPIRFDTRFFAAVVPDGVDAWIDGDELVDAAWVRPATAIERSEDGAWVVAFPTQKTLEWLARFETADAALSHIDRVDPIPAIQPRLSVADGKVEILVPGDPGFEEAAAGERDPNLLVEAVRIIASGGDAPAEFKAS
ncbi:MAG: NUDIX domain-containing protein [Actinomycetota bacterium]